MSPEPDSPSRRLTRRERKRLRGSRFAGRGRLIVGIILAGLFVLLISLRGIASFYTDYLWFDSLSLTSVWRTVLGAKFSLTLIGAGIFFALCWGNLTIADRLAPAFRPSNGDDDLIERYHELIGERTGLVRGAVAVVLAAIVGLGLGTGWNEWILFTHRVDFHQKDATFHTDIGFYVFQLPFLTLAAAWLFSALILVLILVTLAHVVNGGIRFHTQLDRVTPQVKAHISVLLGALALVQGGRYWLDRYQLTFSHRGVVDGATYTDSNVQLRVIYLLIAISVFAFALFIANIGRRGWVLPVMGVSLWLFVTVLAGGLVPAFVQRFRVEPAESSMEAKYIEQNIDATRKAYGLAGVDSSSFEFDGDLTDADLASDAQTIRNIRLWDTSVMRDAYEREQQIKSFYAINDVDIDRYLIDGQLTQVMIGARNLRTAGVPQSSWEATHLAYTHGYGVVAAKANSKDASGGPDLLAEDIPVRTSGGLPETDRPGIYFGENKSGYVIVNTGRREIDYQDGDNKTKFTTYDGKDGIRLGSGFNGYVRRAAFALRFGDVNPLISGNIESRSKVLIERDVTARLEAVAPFLAYDHDPYVVLLGDDVKYVVDAYTTTANYPNAQRADTGGLDGSSGLRGRSFNYARNSVKAVVDAYDGTVQLYVVDDEDPIIRAYQKAFPDLFTDGDKAPEELRDHFRYPEDLFRVQTQMWTKYHVADPDTFYNGSDAWSIPAEPGADALTDDSSTTTAVGADGQTLTSANRFEPQYLLQRLPGEDTESFVLMRPFVAAASESSSGRTEQRLLTSFMVASSDPDDYGRLRTYVMRGSDLPDGPSIVADNMLSDPDVSELHTLLCQSGSSCELRNLVMVPVGDSLLYVRSLFVRGDESSVPRLERVITSYQGPDGTNIAVEPTLRGALQALGFDDIPDGIEDTEVDPDTTTPTTGDETSSGTDDQTDQEDVLIGKIVKAFDEADAAAKDGDQVTYAKKIEEAKGYAKQLEKLRGEADDSTNEPGGATPTTTTPADVTTTSSAGA